MKVVAPVINAPFCVYGTDDPPYVWLPKELGATIYLNRIVDCVETLQFNILYRSMKIDKHSIPPRVTSSTLFFFVVVFSIWGGC